MKLIDSRTGREVLLATVRGEARQGFVLRYLGSRAGDEKNATGKLYYTGGDLFEWVPESEVTIMRSPTNDQTFSNEYDGDHSR